MKLFKINSKYKNYETDRVDTSWVLAKSKLAAIRYFKKEEKNKYGFDYNFNTFKECKTIFRSIPTYSNFKNNSLERG